MVEQFFDIIYSVHVEAAGSEGGQLRGRAGKHCGQKRTYRAVADQYAFIPREAISKFLLYCVDCQRKNAGGQDANGNPLPGRMKYHKTYPKTAALLKAPTIPSSSTPLPRTPSPSLSQFSTVSTPHSLPVSNQPSDLTPMDHSHLAPSGMTPAAAAAALSQAVAAMQSLAGQNPFHPSPLMQSAPSPLLVTRATLLSNALHHQHSGASPFGRSYGLNNPNLSQGNGANDLRNELSVDTGNEKPTNEDLVQPLFGSHSLGGKFENNIDLSLPITSTYLRQMRALGMSGYDRRNSFNEQRSVSKDFMDLMVVNFVNQ